MKRVLSLVLVLMLVLTSIVPAFAEEATNSEAGQALYDFGLIAGDGVNLNEDSPLTRAQMTVILARMYGDADIAEAYELPTTLTDAGTDMWYTPWVNYAFATERMIGNGTDMFSPDGFISAKQIKVLMLKALGYTVEWETVDAMALEAGIVVTSADATQVTRGEIFATVRAALDLTAMDAEMTLGSTLELEGYVAPVVEPEVPETLEVVSVTANNLKALTIKFNKEIDEDYLDEITVDQANTLTLLDDMMTVVAVYDAAVAQGATVEIEIDETDGLAYTWSDRVYDMADPTVLSIEATSPKEIVMTFDEPTTLAETASFKVYNNIKRDTISVVAKVSAVDLVTNEVTFEFPSLLAAGTYAFVVTEVADYAGFETPETTFSVVIAVDEAAPVAESVEVTNLTTIEVTFNETIAVKGMFKVDGVDETADTVIDGKVATITVPELSLAATVEVKVEYMGQKDLVGNEVADYVAITTTVEDDVTLPVVEFVLGEANVATATFTKTMLTSVGTITVTDADDAEVVALDVSALTFKADTNNTVLEFTAADLGLDNTDPAAYTIVFEDMQDATVRKNLLPDATFTIDALDTKVPTVETTYLTTAAADADDEDEITFYFSEAMDQATIENLTNYILSGDNMTIANVADSAFVSMGSDGKSVTLSVPGADAANDSYVLIGLKDLAGNILATATITEEADTDIDIVSATATATDTVVVVFDAAVASVDPSAFYLADDTLTGLTTENLVFTAAVIDADDNTIVTFTVDGDLPADVEGGDTWTLIANNTELVVNLYGNDLSDNFVTETYIAGETLVDKIVPAVDTVTVAVADPGVIVVTFTEAMNAIADATGTFEFTVMYDDVNVTADIATMVVAGSTLTITMTTTEFVADDVVIVEFSPVAGSTFVDFSTTNALEAFTLTETVE